MPSCASGDERASGRRVLKALRLAALCIVIVLGALKFASVANAHYPIEHWLIWRYAGHWLLSSLFALACVSAGGAVLGALRLFLPRAERVLMSFAVGFYLFFLSMFLGGVLRLYGPVFSIALPIVMILVGLPRSVRRFARFRRPLWNALRGPVFASSPWAIAIALFGVVGFLLVYVPTLTPHNTAADARWYHLVLAENYASAGGIIRSAEGSFPAAYPQLATITYTWAFILPRTALFDRVEIAAHLEVMIFIWTLLGIGVLAARVVPRRKIGVLWTSIFLFPGLFLYDSSLSVAADHVLAFWGPLIFLSLLRALPAFEPKRCLLFGVMIAGACLTKYQAGCLVFLPLVALCAGASWRLVRVAKHTGRFRVLAGVATAGFACVVLTAPHWAKNAIWYRDPFYPLLHRHFAVRPWSPDATTYFDTVFRAAFWRPADGSLLSRVKETALALGTFSFEPHDWGGFHGTWPVFGSLFTLTTLCLPFIGRARRLWGLYACTYGGLFIWYWASHQDRYLQALVPWMAAATGAMIVRVWQLGIVTRLAVSLLIGLQVVWGGDVPFFPTHSFLGTTPFKSVLDLAATGYKEDYVGRLRPFAPWPEMKQELPKTAKVLVHGDLGPLGLGRMTVSDMTGWQGGISYGRYDSPAKTQRALRELGVTHIVWTPDNGPGANSLADDLVFYSFVTLFIENPTKIGNHRFAPLPEQPLPDDRFGWVLLMDRVEGYVPGLYPLNALTVAGFGGPTHWKYPSPVRLAPADPLDLLSDADYVVTDTGRDVTLPGFVHVMTRTKKVKLWARKRPVP